MFFWEWKVRDSVWTCGRCRVGEFSVNQDWCALVGRPKLGYLPPSWIKRNCPPHSSRNMQWLGDPYICSFLKSETARLSISSPFQAFQDSAQQLLLVISCYRTFFCWNFPQKNIAYLFLFRIPVRVFFIFNSPAQNCARCSLWRSCLLRRFGVGPIWSSFETWTKSPNFSAGRRRKRPGPEGDGDGDSHWWRPLTFSRVWGHELNGYPDTHFAAIIGGVSNFVL